MTDLLLMIDFYKSVRVFLSVWRFNHVKENERPVTLHSAVSTPPLLGAVGGTCPLPQHPHQCSVAPTDGATSQSHSPKGDARFDRHDRWPITEQRKGSHAPLWLLSSSSILRMGERSNFVLTHLYAGI